MDPLRQKLSCLFKPITCPPNYRIWISGSIEINATQLREEKTILRVKILTDESIYFNGLHSITDNVHSVDLKVV